ncbi:hypothetical protein [Streptomyces acidiscabies]|uniref:hypothetical protein n=1 Tax=Streptomyces acidiscabies TaxID=42234 RepID=UPI0038F6EC65
METRQLYVEGRRAERFAGGVGGKLTVTKTGYVTGSPAPSRWRRAGDVEFVYRSGYVEGRCGVAGVARGAAVVTQAGPRPGWRRGLWLGAGVR